jgi:hypothetical protein
MSKIRPAAPGKVARLTNGKSETLSRFNEDNLPLYAARRAQPEHRMRFQKGLYFRLPQLPPSRVLV